MNIQRISARNLGVKNIKNHSQKKEDKTNHATSKIIPFKKH